MSITEKRRSARTRQQARRERMKALGFRTVTVWVHTEDRERFDQYVQKLLKARMPD